MRIAYGVYLARCFAHRLLTRFLACTVIANSSSLVGSGGGVASFIRRLNSSMRLSSAVLASRILFSQYFRNSS